MNQVQSPTSVSPSRQGGGLSERSAVEVPEYPAPRS